MNFLVVLLLLFTHTAFSQDTTTVKPRPKVGLVLSGGGAKGAAHIGVLKYIEEIGLPIEEDDLVLPCGIYGRVTKD